MRLGRATPLPLQDRIRLEILAGARNCQSGSNTTGRRAKPAKHSARKRATLARRRNRA